MSSQVAKEAIPVKDRTKLSAKVARIWEGRLACGTAKRPPSGPEDFVVSVEVNPAPGLSTEKPVAVARMLREAGVDVVNIADGPRATVRMSNTALAEAIQREVRAGTQLLAASSVFRLAQAIQRQLRAPTPLLASASY